jgi:hypothetical protein
VTHLPPSASGHNAKVCMTFAETHRLVEADRLVFDAHQRVRRQRKIVAEFKAGGKSSHAANAILALMTLTLPIFEDLRQQALEAVTSSQ